MRIQSGRRRKCKYGKFKGLGVAGSHAPIM